MPLEPYPALGPVDPPSWYLEGAWSHEATGDSECLYGALSIPPGVMIDGARVVYSSAATARGEVTISFTAPDVILDGHNYLVAVCTADDFGLFGLEINTG